LTDELLTAELLTDPSIFFLKFFINFIYGTFNTDRIMVSHYLLRENYHV